MDPIIEWLLGTGVTVILATIGGCIKYLLGAVRKHKEDMYSEIAAIKDETHTKIESLKLETEARRQETRDTLLQLINTKFDAIWESIRDVKDRIN